MGFAPPHGTLRDGLRCSANKGYIRPVSKRQNLDILLRTVVSHVDIDPWEKKATGVTFEHNLMTLSVRAKREVILSAGAIASPHILMLSGVGPRDQLSKHSIPIIQNLPGVGKNLQDHISCSGAIYTFENKVTEHNLSFIVPSLMNTKSVESFLHNHTGFFYAMPVSEVMGFLNTKFQDPSENWPDVQLFMGSYGYGSDGGVAGRR